MNNLIRFRPKLCLTAMQMVLGYTSLSRHMITAQYTGSILSKMYASKTNRRHLQMKQAQNSLTAQEWLSPVLIPCLENNYLLTDYKKVFFLYLPVIILILMECFVVGSLKTKFHSPFMRFNSCVDCKMYVIYSVTALNESTSQEQECITVFYPMLTQ